MVIPFLATAILIFLISYFPGVGMYIVIPAAITAQVQYVPVMVWSVVGNYAPAVTIVFLYETLMQRRWCRRVLARFTNDRMQRWTNDYGWWFIFFVTPWTGTWITGVTAKVLGMDNRRFLLVSIVSLTLFALTQASMIALGVWLVPQAPGWLEGMLHMP
jgi:membrane protein DedA with SNARE-associated domain